MRKSGSQTDKDRKIISDLLFTGEKTVRLYDKGEY